MENNYTKLEKQIQLKDEVIKTVTCELNNVNKILIDNDIDEKNKQVKSMKKELDETKKINNNIESEL